MRKAGWKSAVMGLGFKAALCVGLCAVGAAQAQQMVIGECVPLTGNVAATGRAMALGVSLAVKEANAQGGIGGQPVKLVQRDDGYVTQRTIDCTREMIQKDKVHALIGYAGTGNISQMLNQRVLAEGPTALIAPLTGGMVLRSPHQPQMFHIRASYDDEINAIVDHIMSTGAVKRVAAFYQDDAFGQSGFDALKKALAQRQLELVGVGTYPKNTEDVDAGLKAVVEGKPQAVVMVGIAKPLAVFLKKMRDQLPSAIPYTLSVVTAAELVEVAGPQATRGLVISQVMPHPLGASTLKIVRDYQAALQQYAPGEPRSYVSFELYVGARVLLEAMRRAKAPTPAAVLASLETLKADIDGFKVAFEPQQHVGARAVSITVLDSKGQLKK